jgi:hypothetical protein
MKIPVTITRKQNSTTVTMATNAKGLLRSETIIVELQGALESSSKDLETEDPQATLEGAEIGLMDISNAVGTLPFLQKNISRNQSKLYMARNANQAI